MCALAAARLEAHIPEYGAGTLTRVEVLPDRIGLTFDLSYSGLWAQAEMLAMDSSRDAEVQEREADRYAEDRWRRKIEPSLMCRLDGREIEIRRTATRHEDLTGKIYAVPFSLYYDLEIVPERPFTPGRAYRLEVEDSVLRGEIPGKPLFLIAHSAGVRGASDPSGDTRAEEPRDASGEGRASAAGPRIRLRAIEPAESLPQEDGDLLQGDLLLLEFIVDPTGSDPAVQDPAGEDTPRGGRSEPEAGEDVLVGTLSRRRGMGAATLFFSLLVVTLYGAAHALAPGHGKSMVAAYLVGTKGRIRDAVILGLATTFTHTITVYLLGIVIFSLTYASTRSQGSWQNLIIVCFGLLSGALLTFLGFFLFVRRYRKLRRSAVSGADARDGAVDGDGGADEDASPAARDHAPERDEKMAQPAHEHEHEHHHDHGPHEREHAHGHHHDHGADAHEHHHDHGLHEHEHEHSASAGGSSHGHRHPHALASDGEHPRVSELIALGFSGGIVPCPAGLATILVGLQRPDDLLFALLLLIFFSAGLGGVLIAIGILLVTGKRLARGAIRGAGFFQEIAWMRRIFSAELLAALDRRGARALRALPAWSCLFIAAVGLFFLARTVLEGRTEIAAIIESARGWLAR
ncbi:MAG: hypothetical protein JXA90_02955 [Planctomycetes bacterium]|nr:hypothetical protein [Planctomycetota bacterium]